MSFEQFISKRNSKDSEESHKFKSIKKQKDEKNFDTFNDYYSSQLEELDSTLKKIGEWKDTSKIHSKTEIKPILEENLENLEPVAILQQTPSQSKENYKEQSPDTPKLPSKTSKQSRK